MKKSVIFLGAAVLALLACNKTTIVDTTTPQEITFKAFANVPTKAHKGIADGLSGTNLNDKDYVIFVSATQINASGQVENAQFMVNEPFRYDAGSGTWRHVTAATITNATPVFSPLFWPAGGAKLNIMATATPYPINWRWGVSTTLDNTYSPVLTTSWSFSIDQLDELVACAKQQTYAATINLTFDHIFSLLIFNVVDADNTGKIVVEDIGFYSDDYLFRRRNGFSSSILNFADDDYDVFTYGYVKATATNTNVKLDWTLRKGGDYTYSPVGISWPSICVAEDTDFSDCNLPAITTGMHFNSVTDEYDPLTDTAIEYGHVLIAPQPKQAMTIRYRIKANGDTDTEDVYMDYTYALTGNWQAGKKYIYNISFDLNEITITPTVTDWVDGAEPDIDL